MMECYTGIDFHNDGFTSVFERTVAPDGCRTALGIDKLKKRTEI